MKQALARVAASLAVFFRRVGGAIRRHPFATAALAPVAAVALVVAYVMSLVPLTPSIGDIKDRTKAEQPTVVLTADGKQLVTFRRINRAWVKLQDISPNVVHALLATEDHRFYEHNGMDFKRTMSAAVHTLTGDREGGSTITQQLARNLYPEQIGRAPTITRKIKEAITALKIESIYSKDEILESYLNTVPFLYNAYGIEVAARTYFGKPAHDLNVLESATLIGMLKGTSYYNPITNPERSLQRRNTVLAQMVKFDQLAPAEFDRLKPEPLHLDFERQEEDLGAAPHLAQQLRRWLIDWGDRNGYDIYADGLVVHTTIDSRLQALATEAVTRQADRLQATANAAWKPAGNQALLQAFIRETAQYKAERERGASDAEALKKLRADHEFVQALWHAKTTLEAGFMAMEPGSGAVRAWVGSRDFKQDQFDHVDQARRQPGSTFKPFVYGAAFEQGVSPDEMLMDAPMEFRIDARTVWKPTDIEDATNQPMSVRDGLVYSKNTITAQLMQRVGPERVAQVARAMGVRQSKLDPVPSLALGTSPVTLKEMVAAYGTIANSGSYVEPIVITRIERRDEGVLADFRPRAPEQGLSVNASQTLLDVMRGVIDRGTGVGIRNRFGLKGDLAGKTGTTQDYTDGWFILMHPQLVSGAWVGFNDNRITMRNDAWGQGAHNALYIVGDFFQQVTKAKLADPKATFAAPHQQPQPRALPAPANDPTIMGRVNDWLGGAFGNSAPQEAQTSAVTVDPRTGVVEPVPARPVLTVPSPAVAGEPRRRGTDSMSGPPRQRNGEFEWQQDGSTAVDQQPRGAATARRRADSESDTAAGSWSSDAPASHDSRATPPERPAGIIVQGPSGNSRRDRPIAIIIPGPNGTAGVERRAPPVVQYTPAPPAADSSYGAPPPAWPAQQ
jgi:penicillin-binding protein 1A